MAQAIARSKLRSREAVHRLSVPSRVSAAVFVAAACANPPLEVRERCAPPLVAGDLVITEVMANPDEIDAGNEWFEIHNATDHGVDATGLVLEAARADGGGARTHFVDGLVLASGAYVVLADADPALPLPPHVTYSYGAELGGLRNEAGRITLRCGDAAVDQVTTGKTREGVAWQLSGHIPPDAAANDDEASWCESPARSLSGMTASPGEANPPCAAAPGSRPTFCRDGVTARAVRPPRPGDVVVTELLADPAKARDAAGEWIEILVRADVDLNGLELGTTPGTPRATLRDERCLAYPVGTRLVFARSAVSSSNGGLPRVDHLLAFGLANGGGGLYVGHAGTVLDEIVYGDQAAGIALALDPRHEEAAANDDADAWCHASTSYGLGDEGTPGAANASCPDAPSQGTCRDGDRVRDVVPPRAGALVITEVMADPTKVGDAAGEWFEVWVAEDADLNDLELGTIVGADPPVVRERLASETCLRAPAGTHLVFARSTTSGTNGGLPRVDHVFDFDLANSARGLFVGRGSAVVDAASYPAPTPGAAASLSPASRTAEENDAASAWCVASVDTTYGAGDRGTPGAENPACP